MKTKEKYMNELSIIDGIKKCVIRYAILTSKEYNIDETKSEWYKEYMNYLYKRENKINKKLNKLMNSTDWMRKRH